VRSISVTSSFTLNVNSVADRSLVAVPEIAGT
jgi:hypothetical protein